MCAGFQRVFEDNGGKMVQKLFPPLNAPDYGTYIAQLKTERRRDLPRLRRLERLPLPASSSANTADKCKMPSSAA